MTDKPKVAFYWCASCGGCEEAVVDLAEKVLDVVAAVDIVFWPVALDFKRKDVEAMADGSLAAAFINGAIRSTEQEEMVHLLRRMLHELGIEDERFRLEWISASEAEPLRIAVNDMVEKVRALGPLNLAVPAERHAEEPEEVAVP